MAWANQSQLCEGKRSLPWAGNEHGDRRRAAGPALTPWEAQAAFYVVHFLQGKLSPWQGPWTSLGLLRTSGSLLPLSCTTRRSAHRWTTWTVCTTLSVPLWESVGNGSRKTCVRMLRKFWTSAYQGQNMETRGVDFSLFCWKFVDFKNDF